MSKTRFVAFATQKGGIGKSTITALVANYIHNVKGFNVAVIDCDEPQHNIADLRDEEMELIKDSAYFKAQACEHFKKLGKKSFSVTRSNAVNALDDAETVLLESEVKLDFIFFDMPGTIKSEGVMKTLSQMDYIFVPVSADRFVIESALSFVQLFYDNLVTPGLSVTKELAFFWTMVDKRERTNLYEVYEGMFASLGYSLLNTRLPDSKRFRRELSENRKAVFRSTIFPADPNLLRGSGIKELSDEICEIIKT